jgi:hypothetical protein
VAQAETALTRARAAREVRAQEMYVSYDLPQRTRGGGTAIFPKVKRVYIPGEIQEWAVGNFRKRSGRHVFGVKVTYRVPAEPTIEESQTDSRPDAGRVSRIHPTYRRFTQVIGLPEAARNVQLHEAQAPGRAQYLRSVR